MILVTGATGTNGIELIHQLSAMGEPVRALARNPEKAGKLLPPDVEITRGDLDDPQSLVAAMEGIEKVFLLAAVDPRQVQLEKNVIDAARAVKIRALVKFSVLHADVDSPTTLLRYHGQTEQNIRDSGLPFTFLRPNMFMQELLRQSTSIISGNTFYFPFDSNVRISLVDVRDNAKVAARILSEDGHEGKTYDITGPAAVSFQEIAEIASRVLNRSITFSPVTMEQWMQGFASTGAPAWLVNVIAELYRTFVPLNAVVTDTVQKLTGSAATSIEQFFLDHRSAFV